MGLPCGSPYLKRPGLPAQDESFAQTAKPHIHFYAARGCFAADFTKFVLEAVCYE